MYMGDSNQLATLQLAVECFNHSATSHHTGQIVKDKVIMSCKTQRIQRAHNILTDCLCICTMLSPKRRIDTNQGLYPGINHFK